MVSQTDYEFVKKNTNPKIRDEFVKSIDLGEYSEYIDGVRYFPKDDKKHGYIMITIPQKNLLSRYHKRENKFIKEISEEMGLSTLGKIIGYPITYLLSEFTEFNNRIKFKNSSKPKIIIFPFAFSNGYYSRLEDFIGTLKYHEGFHAKEKHQLNPLMIDIPEGYYEYFKYYIRTELRAYENQITNFNNKNSVNYINFVNENKEKFEKKLKEIEKFTKNQPVNNHS